MLHLTMPTVSARRTSARRRPYASGPGTGDDLEPGDVVEVVGAARVDRQPVRKRGCGDHRVVGAGARSGFCSPQRRYRSGSLAAVGSVRLASRALILPSS